MSGHFENVRPYPRVAFTPGSIAKVVTARRRYVCGNHMLSRDEKHFIDPGQRYVRNSLPPHNPEIGNDGWWWSRFCFDCCPIQHDERLQADHESAPEAGASGRGA